MDQFERLSKESVAHSWLAGLIYRFRRENYGTADAAQVRQKMSSDNLRTLREIHKWIDAVLCAGNDDGARQGTSKGAAQ